MGAMPTALSGHASSRFEYQTCLSKETGMAPGEPLKVHGIVSHPLEGSGKKLF